MSKSLMNRGPAWSRRMASAARAITPGAPMLSFVSAVPGRKVMTSIPRSGR